MTVVFHHVAIRNGLLCCNLIRKVCDSRGDFGRTPRGLNFFAHHSQGFSKFLRFLVHGLRWTLHFCCCPCCGHKTYEPPTVMTHSDAVRGYLSILSSSNCNSYIATRSPCSLEILHRTRSQLAERSWYARMFRRHGTILLIYVVALDLRYYMHT